MSDTPTQNTPTAGLQDALDTLVEAVVRLTRIQVAGLAAGYSARVAGALDAVEYEAENDVDCALAAVKEIALPGASTGESDAGVCDCRDEAHTGVHECDYCQRPTSNTVDDNQYKYHRACDACNEKLEWQYEHDAMDCDPEYCDRDHAAEAREAHQERMDDMRREETP